MKIILLQDVRGIGRKYDVKEVSDGYARNFLIPRKLGKPATQEALSGLKRQKENWEKQTDILKEKLKKIQEDLENKPLLFKLKLGEKEKVFGSITKKGIEEALKALPTGRQEVVKDLLIEVNLHRPIKTLGSHQVEISLGRGVAGDIQIKVEKE